MNRRHTRLVATFFALSMLGFGCKGDDSSSDGDSSSADSSTSDDGSDDGGTGDDSSDDGGTGDDGSDDGGTGTGSTGTGTESTGTGSTGTDTASTGTDTASTGTDSTDTGTGSSACAEIDSPPECMATAGCVWGGEGPNSECVPFDGDCSQVFYQQGCDAMPECQWVGGECVDA